MNTVMHGNGSMWHDTRTAQSAEAARLATGRTQVLGSVIGAFPAAPHSGLPIAAVAAMQVGAPSSMAASHEAVSAYSKTVPYATAMSPEPLVSPAFPPAASASPRPPARPSTRPPLAVICMLMAAVLMLVASGSMAINALLELV